MSKMGWSQISEYLAHFYVICLKISFDWCLKQDSLIFKNLFPIFKKDQK